MFFLQARAFFCLQASNPGKGGGYNLGFLYQPAQLPCLRTGLLDLFAQGLPLLAPLFHLVTANACVLREGFTNGGEARLGLAGYFLGPVGHTGVDAEFEDLG